MRFIGKFVVGCLAVVVGFVAFFLVIAGLAVVTLAIIPAPGDRIATVFGVLAFGAAGVIGATVTWKALPRLARLLAVKPERELAADWLRPRLETGEVIRALLAGGVVHDAPGWSEAIPVLGGPDNFVTLSAFLESTCSLALTDRRILLVLKPPFGDPVLRAYPIDDVLTTGLDLGSKRIVMTLHRASEAPLTVGFNYVLDSASRHDAEIIAQAFEGRRNEGREGSAH